VWCVYVAGSLLPWMEYICYDDYFSDVAIF
jgi:hypothetical protein